ncbi:MAG: acyl-CoA dehydrogenase family protein [Hyphomicrobiales bacterium]
MIQALDHIAYVVHDLEAALDGYTRLFGRAPNWRADMHGASQAWFQFGNMALDVISPTGEGPTGDAIRARLASHGEGFYGVGFSVPDVAEAGRRFERLGLKNRLGEEGDGFRIAMSGLDGGRLNIAACSVGGAQAALDKALVYAGERKAFGRKLNEFQALQFRLADLATELEAARPFLYAAAASYDRGDADRTSRIAMAKRFVTDTGFEVANGALQILGGYGYLSEYGIEKIVRDLRVHQILEGTNEIMRLIVARSLIAEKA